MARHGATGGDGTPSRRGREAPRRRTIDRVADASVLLPAGLGVFVLVADIAEYGRPTSTGIEVLAIFAGISGLLHLWFRAEDRWALRRRQERARRVRQIAGRG